MTRLAFLRMIGLAPMARYGSMGQAFRRPDQQTDTPPTAVAPTQAAGVLRARLVIIFGTGPNRGLFVYNGTPAKGTLVAQIVPPGVTSDPYGNSVSAVANFGKWNASGTLLEHFGVNADGDTFLANSSGLVVQHAHSVDGSTWFYSTAGEGLGNLITSIAPAAGTDSAGNSYVAGIGSYSGGFTGQLFAGVLKFFSQSSPPSTTPQIETVTAAASGTNLNVISGKGTAGATGVTATFWDSLASSQAVSQVVIGAVLNSVAPSTTALLEVQGTIQTTSLNAIIASGNLQSQLGDIIASAGNVLINTIGKGLRVKEGSGAKMGTVLLSGGTATVNNTNVTASSRILLTAQDNLSTGALRISARTAGTSFTITSSVAGDAGVVAWFILEPA